MNGDEQNRDKGRRLAETDLVGGARDADGGRVVDSKRVYRRLVLRVALHAHLAHVGQIPQAHAVIQSSGHEHAPVLRIGQRHHIVRVLTRNKMVKKEEEKKKK